MSTFAFGALSAPGEPVAEGAVNRLQLAPAAATTASTTKVGKYVTVLAGLVPAEALAAHAAIVAIAITVDQKATPPTTTLDKPALKFAFWGLIVVCALLYVAGKYTAAHVTGGQAVAVKWTLGDLVRAAVGPCAFVAWTMIQKDTAFDAVAPKASEGLRNAIAIVVAVGLAAIAAAIGYKTPESA
jgi:hypothetical protein